MDKMAKRREWLDLERKRKDGVLTEEEAELLEKLKGERPQDGEGHRTWKSRRKTPPENPEEAREWRDWLDEIGGDFNDGPEIGGDFNDGNGRDRDSAFCFEKFIAPIRDWECRKAPVTYDPGNPEPVVWYYRAVSAKDTQAIRDAPDGATPIILRNGGHNNRDRSVNIPQTPKPPGPELSLRARPSPSPAPPRIYPCTLKAPDLLSG